MKSEDRRVKKTKKAITNALISLLQQKELRSITVRELTDLADIHRATFYVHYQDVYDLYEQVEDNVIAEWKMILTNRENHTYDKVYRAVVGYVLDNKELCKMFFCPTANKSFEERIGKVLEEQYLAIWCYEDQLTEVTEEMRMLTTYNIGGCMRIIARWIESKFACNHEVVIELLERVNDNFELLTTGLTM